MKRIFSFTTTAAVLGVASATVLGLSSALMADPVAEAKELVTAYYEASLTENWDAIYLQFDETAEISVSTDYGYGGPATTMEFLASEWGSLPEPTYSEADAALLADYSELSRSMEIVEATEVEGGVMVRAFQTVSFKTSTYEGTVAETDAFLVTRSFGQPLIQDLTSTHVYQ
ncbi:hypothetical protein [Sulfitobacter geojensis]|uniref:hypothetical protein n=1 Tax=Sulfitobacter geojensis TaxID=1342299 RepID=UPI002490067B|nr:hypothetical protein [Sulfitobacter geojensis]